MVMEVGDVWRLYAVGGGREITYRRESGGVCFSNLHLRNVHGVWKTNWELPHKKNRVALFLTSFPKSVVGSTLCGGGHISSWQLSCKTGPCLYFQIDKNIMIYIYIYVFSGAHFISLHKFRFQTSRSPSPPTTTYLYPHVIVSFLDLFLYENRRVRSCIYQ